MTGVNLAAARTIITAALAHGRAQGMKPLCVVVLDAGGHVVACEREDGASNGRFDIARGKAGGALALGMNSRTLGLIAVERPHFINGATAALGTLIPVAGGVLIVQDGRTVGAVGISGDTSDHDEAAAVVGIRAAGLQAAEQ